MYDSLNSLQPISENIPADLFDLMLTATKNISFYSGLVKEYPYSQLLTQIRYLLNYKYSRFNYDQKTDLSELMTDDSSEYYFFKNRHHVDVSWGIETLKESVAVNEKLPLYQLIRYSEFLETRNVLKLEIESSTDEKVKYRVKLLWEMLSNVYACDTIPTMLKLVNFWTKQHFFEYKFDIKPLHIESFELLLNQELCGSIEMQADSLYINKAIIQSNLCYITTPDQYRGELLKILCECFTDAEKLIDDIGQYILDLTTHIE